MHGSQGREVRAPGLLGTRWNIRSLYQRVPSAGMDLRPWKGARAQGGDGGHTHHVAVQLQVEVALVRVQPHVALLLHKLVAQHILIDGSCEPRPSSVLPSGWGSTPHPHQAPGRARGSAPGHRAGWV